MKSAGEEEGKEKEKGGPVDCEGDENENRRDAEKGAECVPMS